MSSSASSNKRSTWKRLRRPDPSVTSLCNQFAEVSISASSNNSDETISLCNQFAEMSISASSNNSDETIEQEMSSSSSSIQNSFKYDVFLSFRGEDTRKTFVDHLYEALKDKGIYTYKDDERIEQGKTIDNQLIQAIRGSRFFIIVFSQNYASSSWCLDELVEIMECQKTGKQIAYPAFFDVEPTHVRYQSGPFGKAFLENKNKDAAGKWVDALKGAASLAGWELKNTLDGHEAKFIKKIVQQISLELRSINFSFDEKLVGMETRARDVISSLEIGIDEVRMIGIKGMGGAGKTTTARAVFDHLSADFKAKIFVEDVREVSNGSVSGLKNLQEQVLSKVLNEHVTLDSVNDGKNMMKRRMCSRKVLLVLDDVDHIGQLEALASGPNWFKPGSRIIITTRDEQVLVAHRVNVIRDIALLSEQEAICLFSRYAFGTENRVQGYEELSGKVVRYAAGLPLTLKVLGSFLCGKDKLEWVDAIDRLEKIPLKDTLEKLELSYRSLEDDHKEIFLDIACILKGETKEDAIRILESCGFNARIGLKVLEQRSLITVDYIGALGMHDHIEEMGKNIVRRSHPDEPNKHSRLWIEKEIQDILANDMGTQETRCLKLDKLSGNVDVRILMKGLGKMKELGYLELNLERDFEFEWDFEFEQDDACLGKMKILRYLKLKVLGKIEQKRDEATQYFPNSLKYLRCEKYPFLYLPKTFEANNLVRLEMERCFSMVLLWKERKKKVLIKLKFLSLSWSKLTTFDFGMTPNLETLSLKDSYYLKELCMPDTCHKLKHLNISDSEIRSFDLRLTPNLETLSLKNSYDLKELCMPDTCHKLKHLYISESKLRSFDLRLTPNLESLSLESSDRLEKLCMPVSCEKLNYLCISHSKLRTFDLRLTPNLETLSLEGCARFEELHVSAACPNLKVLNLFKSRLRSLNLELIPNLESLDLRGCDNMVEINASIGYLKKVGYLNLSGCLRFTNFVFDIRCEPNVNCSSATLDLVTESVDLCPLHPNSNLPKFRFRCNYKEDLLSSVGNIEKLMSFGLCACTDFKKFSDMICSLRCLKKLTLRGDIPEFPKDVGQLECLEELCLFSAKIKHLPDSICMLKHLKYLNLDGCALLEKLPEDIGRLESLKRLDLFAAKIKHLPDSVCMLKHLKHLNLHRCALLEKLPEDLGQLECLKELVIRYTGISHLPQSIFGLKGMCIYASKELLQLYDFPSEIKTRAY